MAASAWMLLLGACADRPVPLAHPSSQATPGASPAGTSDQGADSGRPAPGAKPESSASPAEPVDPSRDRQLAEHYGRAKALSVQHGTASYYADKFAGRRTASGALYEPRAMMAAHRSLPFGTVVRVTRIDDARSVYVRITDRGPFARGRIVDLSRAAAEELGMVRAGVVKVKLEVLELGPPRKQKQKQKPRRRRR